MPFCSLHFPFTIILQDEVLDFWRKVNSCSIRLCLKAALTAMVCGIPSVHPILYGVVCIYAQKAATTAFNLKPSFPCLVWNILRLPHFSPRCVSCCWLIWYSILSEIIYHKLLALSIWSGNSIASVAWPGPWMKGSGTVFQKQIHWNNFMGQIL